MLPLSLHVSPGNWRIFTSRKEDPAFQSVIKKVFTRDDYACQYCGFQAQDFQEVVNIDNNYKNYKLSNLATACCFCSQCAFLESVGVSGFGGGVLIYLPELSQTELNSFCHVLFCAMANGTNYNASAQTIYRNLKFRNQIIEQKYGDGSSNPAIFGQLLIDAAANTSEKIDQETVLKDCRLLPSRGRFKMQIERWAEAAMDELSE